MKKVVPKKPKLSEQEVAEITNKSDAAASPKKKKKDKPGKQCFCGEKATGGVIVRGYKPHAKVQCKTISACFSCLEALVKVCPPLAPTIELLRA